MIAADSTAYDRGQPELPSVRFQRRPIWSSCRLALHTRAELKPGAALVIPVDDDYRQVLKRITRDEAGTVTVDDVLPVAFVPLIKTH